MNRTTKEFDIVVLGAGPAGLAAALAAARNGAKVLLADQNGYLGGNMTLGLPWPRVAVDHWTALDLAGTGRADPSSLIAAISSCARLAAARRGSATAGAPA